MKRITWLSDIHLNFLSTEGVREFLASVRQSQPDAVLLGGDIGEAHDVVEYLTEIDDALGVPVYFVLGNHDYYHGSIRDVRAPVEQLCAGRPRLHYLSAIETPIELTGQVGLVGHDGWGDARLGDYEHSRVQMSDDLLIEDLRDLDRAARRKVLEALGDEAAAQLRRVLPMALDQFSHAVLLTHVPPLREACWHEGRLSDDEWAPFFTCAAVGAVVLDAMRSRPDRQMTLLCGHTHSGGECQPLPNLRILTAESIYGHPQIQQVFEFD